MQVCWSRLKRVKRLKNACLMMVYMFKSSDFESNCSNFNELLSQQGQNIKYSSDTGTRTQVSCVKGKGDNHLHYIGTYVER